VHQELVIQVVSVDVEEDASKPFNIVECFSEGASQTNRE
jgi:hypothetical protein